MLYMVVLNSSPWQDTTSKIYTKDQCEPVDLSF